MMLLNELLAGFTKQSIDAIDVKSIAMDSRTVVEGGLFFSLAKQASARVSYLQQAISAGVAVILSDKAIEFTAEESAIIAQSDCLHYEIDGLDDHVSAIAARFYGNPSTKIKVLAVTGTNGKTSVSHFIAQALANLNFKSAIIGTLGVGQLEQLVDTGMTTPNPVLLQATLAGFVEQGVSHVVMEASSHALEQNRLASVEVDVAVFTNLSRDHLDYHKTMAAYGKAKQRLFEFESVKHAVINNDDAFGQQLIELLATKQASVISYGEHADLQINNVQCELTGLDFELSYQQNKLAMHCDLLGQFNSENVAATAAALMALDVSFEQMTKALTQVVAVDGRMQSLQVENQPHVVVDYAHTPDALNKVLISLRQHVTADGQLWCVFGCGGDRDKGKRALMGQVAEQQADKLVLTADNPRSESNQAIVDDILSGMSYPAQAHIEHNRAKAIDYAVTNASANDFVLVAGKGHEDYQEIDGVKQSFSDIQASLTALKAANDAIEKMVGGQG